MKCLVTILQNKRVALPTIFHRYCLPAMRKKFKGEMSVVHVFHTHHSTASHMKSNKELGADRIECVEQFIRTGRYGDAVILRHQTTYDDHPIVPSLKLALQKALDSKADFHLWLEDDAIVYDLDCDTWATTIASGDAGLYQDTDKKHMINTAHFISTPELDRRYLNILLEFRRGLSISSNKGLWDNFAGKGSLTEHLAWRAARKPIYLGPDKGIRHHPYDSHRETGKGVRTWLERKIPDIRREDLNLLELDFND